MKETIKICIISLYLFGVRPVTGRQVDANAMRNNLVRINVTAQQPDYRTPWNPGKIGSSYGSGFIISGRRIMTNAHVVSNARYISVDKDGDWEKRPARVIHIAHDCDLALLELPEHPDFFDNAIPLEFGSIPELHSTVTVFGYPIGGERLSVTRGVVSRIEFRTYAHSGLDSHLSVQIDAAINPGNSGGPVLQDGAVVGVAFQGYSGAVAQNTGYMIPVPVINRFFGDIEDGRYDGYVELGIEYLNLQNPSYRKFLGLPDDGQGVVVTNVLTAGSAGGLLLENDILLKIDGHSITNNGHINLDGELLQMEEVVERKFHGDSVQFQILRDGNQEIIDVLLKGAWPYRMLVRKYDTPPEFLLFAGLLLQPLSRDFLAAYQNKDVDLNYYFTHYIRDELYLENPQLIVISDLLPDPVNTYWDEFRNSLVDKINDVKIRTLHDAAVALDMSADQFVIELIGKNKPIVVEREVVEGARTRILERYGVVAERYLETETN